MTHVQTPWLGWIGSDDLISQDFDLYHLRHSSNSIVSFSTVFFESVLQNVCRYYYVLPFPSLRRFGFHLPHFSTFIRTSLAHQLTFNILFRNFADQIYFLEAEQLSTVSVVNSVSTLMQAGGSSNTSVFGILKTNLHVFTSISKISNLGHASIFIILKLLYKISQKYAILFLK